MGLQVRLPSFSAQALATAEFGALLPGMVAQPPFSMRTRRSQEETLLNATSLAAASVCCWNFSTQIGVSAATTAVSARWVAIFSAVLPSVHPSDENPTTVNATAPTTAPHTAGFTPGWTFISSPCTLGEGNFSLFQHRVISAWRAREGRLGNYSEDARPVSNVRYRRRGDGACPPGGGVPRTLTAPGRAALLWLGMLEGQGGPASSLKASSHRKA